MGGSEESGAGRIWPLAGDVNDIVEAIQTADTLEEAVYISIGAASACWDNLRGAGTFESERAKTIADTLLELVRDYVR